MRRRDSTVPVCGGECGDEREVSGESKKEKRANFARRYYCCGCEGFHARRSKAGEGVKNPLNVF